MDPEATSSQEESIWPECPSWGCGSNAATLGFGIFFHELDPSGVPTEGGVRLLGAETETGRPVRMRVVGDELTAIALDNPAVVYSDVNVVGIRMALVHAPTGLRFELRVARAYLRKDAILHFWAGDRDFVPAYVFEYRPLDGTSTGQFFDICRASDLDPNWSEGSVITRHAVVFQGDHYSAAWKTVTETPASPAFNVACAGTALAKMHVLRHTRAGAPMDSGLQYGTTVGQRQAMLKMFVADYCGNGHSHTEDGHPLMYMDPRGSPAPPIPALDLADAGGQKLEALWGPGRATCLNDPRMVARADVECQAVLPSCPDQSTVVRAATGWWSGSTNWGYVASSNPMPVP